MSNSNYDESLFKVACRERNFDKIYEMVCHGFKIVHDPFHYSHRTSVMKFLEGIIFRSKVLEENFKKRVYFSVPLISEFERNVAIHWACHHGDFEAVSKLLIVPI